MTSRTQIVPLEAAPEAGQIQVLTLAGRHYLLYHLANAPSFTLLEAICPHQAASLVEHGTILGDKIICLLHGRRYNLPTGACHKAGLPALNTYPVIQENGWLYAELEPKIDKENVL